MNLIDIGKAVRARREQLGLSQGQLAHLSGLPGRPWSAWKVAP
jgi:transcriptional regulator with XRE-family HTH domain